MKIDEILKANIFNSFSNYDELDIEKGKNMPIGSISKDGNYRKVANGKWEKIKNNSQNHLEKMTEKLKRDEVSSKKENKLPIGILGLTRSGKKVYENNKKGDHDVYKDFTIEDHEDAIKFHKDKYHEYDNLFKKLPDSIRMSSGTKGYRIHPLDTKRNTHYQRAIEHEFEISRLKREMK